MTVRMIPAALLIAAAGLMTAGCAQPAVMITVSAPVAPTAVEPAQPAPAASPPAANRIEVPILNLRNREGDIRCALFASSDGFPRERKKAIAGAEVPAEREHPACVFSGLPPGLYAIAVLADENRNGHMDFDLMWLPLEGYGFSNDARGIIGPPSFKAAQFYYGGGTLVVPIKLRY